MTDTVSRQYADCSHERGHITDSMFFGMRYATAASRRIFCDVCRMQRWLDIESALAASEAELGIIPREDAVAIASSCDLEHVDLSLVQAEIERSGHSLVGLLRVLQAVCPDKAGEFIHYGATTQDIQDTGQVLEMRDVLDELDGTLRGVQTRLVELAEQNAGVIATGRTHARAALPMSFGLKVAGWLDEVLRHCQRLVELRERALVVQLFGGAGTMAGFGEQGIPLLESVADRLGLRAPTLGWHVARDRIVEYCATLSMIAGTMGRIAEEIRVLGRPEFGEVSESWRYGMVGSSTMPHKRNPERCEQVVVLAKLAAAQTALALNAMMGDHERDSRTLRVEWACVPDVSHYCLAACEIATEILTGLTVHPERLRANVQQVADQLATERLMLALAAELGKQTAHERVYDLSQEAYASKTPIRELFSAHAELAPLLTEEQLATVFEPASYLGRSRELTDRAVAETRKWLGESA